MIQEYAPPRTVDINATMTPWSAEAVVDIDYSVNIDAIIASWSAEATIAADNYRKWLFDAGNIGPNWLTDDYGTNWLVDAVGDAEGA